MDDKVCRVCARLWAGRGHRCERCRKRAQRGQPPVEPVAQLIDCQGPMCGRVFAVPFGVDVPVTCSGACEGRHLAREAKRAELEAERLAAAEAWAADREQREAREPVPDHQPVYEEQWVMEPMPGAPWSSRSVRRMVRVR